MRKLVAVSLVFAIAIAPLRKTEASPTALPVAPAICATGVGCVLLGVTVVGGFVYYVWRTSKGKNITVRRSQGIGAIEASRSGEAHWGSNSDSCQKISKRLQKPVKKIFQAKGGGVWCVF